MKQIRNIFLTFLLVGASSCALMFNERTVDVSINSNPSGADIFIDGRNYGKTPATVQIEPKNYVVTLNKEGYGSAQFNLESWSTARNGYCIADMMGTMLVVPFYSAYYSGRCDDFKVKEHFINIPRLGPSVGSVGTSLIGIGNSPSNMLDYYYNQDTMKSDMMRNPYSNPYSAYQNPSQ